jgi:hypothetical protein
MSVMETSASTRSCAKSSVSKNGVKQQEENDADEKRRETVRKESPLGGSRITQPSRYQT